MNLCGNYTVWAIIFWNNKNIARGVKDCLYLSVNEQRVIINMIITDYVNDEQVKLSSYYWGLVYHYK